MERSDFPAIILLLPACLLLYLIYDKVLPSLRVGCLSEQVWASPGSGCVWIILHRQGGDSSECLINTLQLCITNI